MFHFFKQRQLKNRTGEDGNERRIPSIVNKMQIKFCHFMSKREKLLTNRQKKVTFWLFCSILGLYFLFILLGVFRTDNTNRHHLPDQSLTPPKDISLPDSLDIQLIQEQKELQKRRDNSKQ